MRGNSRQTKMFRTFIENKNRYGSILINIVYRNLCLKFFIKVLICDKIIQLFERLGRKLNVLLIVKIAY